MASSDAGTNGCVTTAPGAASEPHDSLTADADPVPGPPVALEDAPADIASAPAVQAAPAEVVPASSGRRPWPAWLRELAIVAAVYLSYSLTRNLIPGQVELAQKNARWILDLETTLGLDIELGINRWGAVREWLIVPANYYYATLHLSVTLVVMIWLYRRRHEVYARCRSVLLTMTCMALVSYWLYPLAPPRLMTGASYIDTVKEQVLWGFEPSEDMVSLSNQYAAMPSMHVGWSLWVGVVLVAYGRSRLVRGLGIAYPIATTFVVVVTANHFILDAVGGLLFYLVALLAVDVVTKARARRRAAAPDPILS